MCGRYPSYVVIAGLLAMYWLGSTPNAAAEDPAPKKRRARGYTARIQLHQVKPEVDMPADQVPAERGDDDAGLGEESSTFPAQKPFVMRRYRQAVRRTSSPEKDQNWILPYLEEQDETGAESEPALEGWGWLADGLQEAEERVGEATALESGEGPNADEEAELLEILEHRAQLSLEVQERKGGDGEWKPGALPRTEGSLSHPSPLQARDARHPTAFDREEIVRSGAHPEPSYWIGPQWEASGLNAPESAAAQQMPGLNWQEPMGQEASLPLTESLLSSSSLDRQPERASSILGQDPLRTEADAGRPMNPPSPQSLGGRPSPSSAFADGFGQERAGGPGSSPSVFGTGGLPPHFGGNGFGGPQDEGSPFESLAPAEPTQAFEPFDDEP